MSNIKTILIECPECSGTGLYSGFAEDKNCAVICHKCKGSGSTIFNYKEFKGKNKRKGIKRVFKHGKGYKLSADDVTLKNGIILHYSNYGCTYNEWLNGVEPKEVELREIECPYQCYEKQTNFCENNFIYGRMKSNCQMQKNKKICWNKWDKEIKENKIQIKED